MPAVRQTQAVPNMMRLRRMRALRLARLSRRLRVVVSSMVYLLLNVKRPFRAILSYPIIAQYFSEGNIAPFKKFTGKLWKFDKT